MNYNYRIILGENGKVVDIRSIGTGTLLNAYTVDTMYFYTRDNSTNEIVNGCYIKPNRIKYDETNTDIIDLSFSKKLKVNKGETLYFALA